MLLDSAAVCAAVKQVEKLKGWEETVEKLKGRGSLRGSFRPHPYHRIYISAVVMCGGCETQSRVVCWLMSDPMMRGVCWYVGVNKISMQLHENV